MLSSMLTGGIHLSFGLRELVGLTVIYIYVAYTLMVLAGRLGHKDAWMAWIPFANLYLMTKMAGREWWWVIGAIITPINIFVVPFLWFTIAGRLGKNPWIGAAIIIPFIGLFIPGYLVLATSERS